MTLKAPSCLSTKRNIVAYVLANTYVTEDRIKNYYLEDHANFSVVNYYELIQSTWINKLDDRLIDRAIAGFKKSKFTLTQVIADPDLIYSIEFDYYFVDDVNRSVYSAIEYIMEKFRTSITRTFTSLIVKRLEWMLKDGHFDEYIPSSMTKEDVTKCLNDFSNDMFYGDSIVMDRLGYSLRRYWISYEAFLLFIHHESNHKYLNDIDYKRLGKYILKFYPMVDEFFKD